MKINKKEFLTPEIRIVLMDEEDVVTVSSPHDAVDNWENDIFTKG